jgi:hypothetical protein
LRQGMSIHTRENRCHHLDRLKELRTRTRRIRTRDGAYVLCRSLMSFFVYLLCSWCK